MLAHPASPCKEPSLNPVTDSAPSAKARLLARPLPSSAETDPSRGAAPVWGAIRRIPKRWDLPSLKYEYLQAALDRPACRVLEIGCGAGKFLSSLALDLPRHRYTGVDPNPAALEYARRNAPDVEFHAGSAEALPFPPQSFDVVLALDVLEHVQEPGRVLAEIERVLAPSGSLHAFIPCEAQSVHGLALRLLGFHTKALTCGHVQQYRRAEMLERLRARFALEPPRYSYHLAGSLLDYALFTALLSPALAARFWRDNEYYNEVEPRTQGVLSRAMNLGFRVGNALAYFESKLMSRSPFGSIGLHVTAVKLEGDGRERRGPDNHR